MVAFSKYFYQTVGTKHCTVIIHDGSCIDSTIWNFTRTIGGCAKFVLPLALLPILMKAKKLNKDVFQQSFKIFVDYFIGAWLISGFGLTGICVFRNLLGRIYYPTVLAIPSAMGGFLCSFLLAQRVVYTYAHGLSTIAFEISIHRGDFYIFKILRNYRLAITIAFMCLNTILLHGLRENENGGFYWIVQPLRRKVDYHEFYESSPIMDRLTPVVQSQIKCCEHEKTCDSYIIEGIKKYLKFGLGLEIARSLIYNFNLILSKPHEVFFKRLNWNLISFLVGYVGIYRFVHCFGNRHNIYLSDVQSTRSHQLAAFLSGLAFYLYPNYSIFSHIAITIIELCWKSNYEQIKSLMSWVPLEKIKMMHLVFPIVFGYLNHVRAFTPWLAPSMVKKIMHLTTNYKDASIYTKYHRFLFGLTPQFIL